MQPDFDLQGAAGDVARLERRGVPRAEAVRQIADRMKVDPAELRRELDRLRVEAAVSRWGR